MPPGPGAFGVFRFFTFNLFGAILWGINAAIRIWLVSMLWNMDPRGWMFAAVLSMLNPILVIISLSGAPSWQAMLPSLILNALILIYCVLPGTKSVFGVASAE